MKKSLLIALLFAAFTSIAQTETKTLFNSNSIQSWGFMVGAGVQGGQMYNESVLFSNIRAGAVINQSWTVGGIYGQSINRISPNFNASITPIYNDFDFYYYGAFLEYRIKPNNLLHLTFPLNLGVFESDFDDSGVGFIDLDDAGRYEFFVEPGVNLELNVHKYVRFFAGVSYRLQVAEIYTEGIDLPGSEDHLLWNFGLKVGLFDFK